MVYTIAEKIEILSLGRNNSSRRVAEIFNERHPNCQFALNARTVQKIFRNFRQRGTLERKKRATSIESEAIKTEFLSEVRDLFNNDPHMSTRRAGRSLGTSNSTVWEALKSMKFHPYKMRKAQKLYHDDPAKRKEFCELLIAKINQDPWFHLKILWSDEKPFYLNGCFNRQIYR